MHSPPQEEIEDLFTQVRPNWRAEAELVGSSGELAQDRFDWYVRLYDQANHFAGYARLTFEDQPPRLEFITLDLQPGHQGKGLFTRLYPILGPWLQRYGFEWIVIRDWIDPAPFFKRGFILRDDPSGFVQDKQVLTVDLRDPDRPSKVWVDDPDHKNEPNEKDNIVVHPGPTPNI